MYNVRERDALWRHAAGICDSVADSASCRRRDVMHRSGGAVERSRVKWQSARSPSNDIELRNIR